ncbi:MAG: hypothetical protein J0I80_03230 [Sphingomonas sp.]|nr:hypothetical protein [Sphingomonas sp.]
MRTIEVTTEVYARIWSQRRDGEEDENSILARLLGVGTHDEAARQEGKESENLSPKRDKVRWRDDVLDALKNLGGRAHLSDIYREVREIRLRHGRTVPTNANAIVRRELEQNCFEAGAYTGERNWFRSVEGMGQGIWGIREEGI